MRLSNYGMNVIDYSFDGRKIKVKVQFYHEFLGLCISTAYAWFTGKVLDDQDVIWMEGDKFVDDAIEQRLDSIYRKARKQWRLQQRIDHDAQTLGTTL